MNSAFTHHHAEDKAGRLARRVVLACALVLGAGSALAQQHGDRRDDGPAQQPQRAERFHLPLQEREPRQADPRLVDQRVYEEQRRAQQDQQQERRSGRMTPDERRDLRRQINEAGMDLYPQRR